MTASAAALTPPSDLSRLRYEVGDCANPTVYAGGEFDVVIGSWLLNYAHNGEEMARMFKTAEMNLKKGGRFVCITPHPSKEPRAWMEGALRARPREAFKGGRWITMSPREEVEEGVRMWLEAQTETGFVEFGAFHLRRSVYLRAAREGGFEDVPGWRRMLLPEEGWESEFENWVDVPHFGVMVVRKSEG